MPPIVLLPMMLATLLCAPPQASQGATLGEVQRPTLRGLQGVVVLVNIPPETRETLVSKGVLQTDVELRLRRNGIRVVDSTKGEKTPGRPVLRVNIALYSDRTGELDAIAFAVSTALEQDVVLDRNQEPARGVTWEGFVAIGLSNSKVVADQVRAQVSVLVDKFANDFLAENTAE